MPVVRILKPTPYEPQPGDSPKCWGQARLRATQITEDVVVEVERDNPDGTKTTETVTTKRTMCGPMERYFPVGAKPDLSDELAAWWIAAGIAEVVEGEPAVRFVTGEELGALMNDMKVY